MPIWVVRTDNCNKAQYVVSSTVASLAYLLNHEAKFLLEVESQVKRLQAELIRIQGFLNDADANQDKNVTLKSWLAQVRDAAYDAEDVVETYALKSASKRTGGAINALKRLAGIYTDDRGVGSEIEAITARIFELTQTLQSHGLRGGSSQGEGSSSLHVRRSYRCIVHDIVVGVEKNVEELVTYLVSKEAAYPVVCICGQDGLGKTTLAKKVYHHRTVRCHFDHFAWVHFYDEGYEIREIYERILYTLTSPTREQRERILALRDEELVSEFHQLISEKKCLVVLDDITGIEAVKNLLRSLVPTSSKILLTDNHPFYFWSAKAWITHEAQLLNREESWELLQKIARSGRNDADFNIDQRMEKFGMNMVDHCKGLPLAITVLGGILATKYSSNEWKMVQDNIESLLRQRKVEDRMNEPFSSDVITLSYMDLPTPLKPCLLYLSQFPKEYEINVNKLIQLWIAEGFVQPALDTEDEEMLEDVADCYLNELILRRMVLLRETDANLRIKTCRLHPVIRDLCLSKEQDWINYYGQRDDVGGFSASIRRLAIHMQGHSCQFPQDNIPSPNLRSLLCFYDYDFSDERWRLQNPIFDKLKLLRVLDLERVDVSEENLLKDVGELIHLRFLSLRHARVSKIPSSIGNLRWLQTLDLLIEGIIVHVPNVIWKMERLRHLYLPEFCDAKTKLRLDNLTNLRTLVNFPAQNCDVRDLFNMTNLRELTIRDTMSIKNFTKFSKSLSIRLKRLRALSLDNNYEEDDREATKFKDLQSWSSSGGEHTVGWSTKLVK